MITFDSAGAGDAWWGFRSRTSGRFLGAAKTLANGADSAAMQLKGLFSQDLNPQPLRIVSTKGNNGFISDFIFPAEGGPKGTITLGQFDANFYSLPMDNKIYSVGGHWQFAMIQPSDFNLLSVTMIFNSDAQAQDAGYQGNPGYMVDVYPNVRIVPQGGSGMRAAQDSNFTHQAIAQRFDKFPWGEALSLTNQGTRGACGFRFFAPYPVTMHAFAGDGALDHFSLGRTPAAADADSVGVWNNAAAKLAYTSGFTLAAKVLTLTAGASTAAYMTDVMYEYDPTS